MSNTTVSAPGSTPLVRGPATGPSSADGARIAGDRYTPQAVDAAADTMAAVVALKERVQQQLMASYQERILLAQREKELDKTIEGYETLLRGLDAQPAPSRPAESRGTKDLLMRGVMTAVPLLQTMRQANPAVAQAFETCDSRLGGLLTNVTEMFGTPASAPQQTDEAEGTQTQA